MRSLNALARLIALPGLVVLLLAQVSPGQQLPMRTRRTGRTATPTAVSPGAPVTPRPAAAPANAKAARAYDEQRLLAGHLLRRIGFGPNEQEMEKVLEMGYQAYIDQQLNPRSINDSAAEARLQQRIGRYDDYSRIRNWHLRMLFSRRQLQEKMALIWHEHFSTSNDKVGYARLMGLHEDLLRREALGSFRQLLIDMTRDQAMLVWLDNNYNSGTETDDDGNLIPPNENYARELLQLFSLGTQKLNMDGTPVLGSNGLALPNYTEDDVKEVARALTGWRMGNYRSGTASKFMRYAHDAGDKTILGETLAGRQGRDGMREVEDVVDILMRHPSTAPFISKILIQKLATETPAPAYVQRVATVFKQTNGDIKATVRALLLDAEFTAPANVRSQYKTPIEYFVGAVRGLGAETGGDAVMNWCYRSKHYLYHPPSVFSFYRPGQKGDLVNTALATIRDVAADELVSEYSAGVYFDVPDFVERHAIETPEQAVDALSDVLLAGPLQAEVRDEMIAYFGGQVTEEKLRGAIWLIICSPDYQRN
jgi:uncharacterized protein (DUF1800 family)